MKKMGLNEIRKAFLEFFESKGHFARHSYPLVPENDKSLLLINAGMAPLKNYFMGVETPPKKRMTTCQKCIRTGDIENVGKTARHGTFFEMLGNFSFGDYFKNESIHWGWEFVTKVLQLPQEKVWVSVYEKDEEAYKIWNETIGVPKERIVKLGKDDNFWEIGTGPCGPCSELYYDRGEKYGCGHEDCKPGCECDRYVEFWNHVFTQFDKDETGHYNPLPNPNIDTGMGLERVACIMQGVDSIFDIDTIHHILNKVVKLSGKVYGKDQNTDTSIRIITDHIRSVTFMVCDGIMPSNEGRGYVLRRLLRRAARHGKLLGIQNDFLAGLVDSVVQVSGDAYPELIERKEYIKKVICIEEERFQETLDQGSEILKGYITELKENHENVLSKENAFRLYDTYGFPLELTKEILEEEGLKVDEEGFHEEMEKQRQRARNARTSDDEAGWKEDVFKSLDDEVTSKFIGYTHNKGEGKVLAIVKDNELVQHANEGDEVTIILDQTPFYAESGGQSGDKGILENDTCKVMIKDCKKGTHDRIFHIGVIKEGSINVKDTLKACIDIQTRMDTARNHTATHLLQAALREVVGNHVEQAGSLVTKDRLRFDFSHFQGLTQEEIEKVEEIVNDKILESMEITTEEMSIEEAKHKGATALFGEKYKDTVRVVSMGDYSMELCGGTHLNHTSQVGLFKIASENGVAAGIRRIEAITGHTAYEYTKQQQQLIESLGSLLKCNEKDVLSKTQNMIQDVKQLHKEIEKLNQQMASSAIEDILKEIVNIEDVKVISYHLPHLDMDSLRNLGDQLKDKLECGVVVLATHEENKVNFIAMATKNAVERGVHAGNIIREVAKVTGGGGGGRPNMAQAGGKDPSKIDEALQFVTTLVKNQIHS